MLYLQPPSAAGSNAPKLQAPKPASTYTPISTGITAPVRETQEAPPSSVGHNGRSGSAEFRAECSAKR